MKSQTLESLCIDVVAEDSVGYDMPYLGQHGICLLLTARREGGCRRVLVDVAQDPEALLENMRRMQIQPSDIDALVLTHCHYDHTRGAAKVVAAVGRQGLPVVAHPDLFRPHFIMDPGLESVGMAPADSPQEIRAAGGSLLLSRDPLALMPGLTTTGEVPRQTDFETFAMPLFTLVDGRLTPDAMADDLSVVAHVAGRGVVVITGCSHAGIVNICRHALDLAGGGASLRHHRRISPSGRGCRSHRPNRRCPKRARSGLDHRRPLHRVRGPGRIGPSFQGPLLAHAYRPAGGCRRGLRKPSRRPAQDRASRCETVSVIVHGTA